MRGFFIEKFIIFFYIYSMTKAEALAALNASGEIGRFSRTPTWEKAFELYNQATGQNLQPSCGSCFRTVTAWLKS